MTFTRIENRKQSLTATTAIFLILFLLLYFFKYANTVTLDTNTPLLHAYDPANVVEVFNAQPLAIGSVEKVEYFGVQVVQRNYATGRPRVFDLWKGSITNGLTFETSNQDYGSQDLQIDILEPTVEDYASGGPLAHLADIIPVYMQGRLSAGA